MTGGKHMDGFAGLLRTLLAETGAANLQVFCKVQSESAQPKGTGPRSTDTTVPGWFRAEKDWDVLVLAGKQLVAVIELKSHVGSFGNNFNNRVEEVLGNATDLHAAYREGAFKPALCPWLGYLMLLEDAPKANAPVRLREPHFRAFDDFRNASYADRYNVCLTKLVRDRLYNSCCLLMSPTREGRTKGDYREPNSELSFTNFVASLTGHASAVARTLIPPESGEQV